MIYDKEQDTLKSDHFGIEIYSRDYHLYDEFQLKSDHFGIEINITHFVITSDIWLKSDHFGIEMKDLDGISTAFSFVKIRPFWD